jgi:hypothetical protein
VQRRVAEPVPTQVAGEVVTHADQVCVVHVDASTLRISTPALVILAITDNDNAIDKIFLKNFFFFIVIFPFFGLNFDFRTLRATRTPP